MYRLLKRSPPRALPRLLVSNEISGIAAGLAAASIWGGALAMTRLGVAAGGEQTGALGLHDMVLLRFLPPAALLAPIGWRVVVRLGRTEWLRLLMLVAGGGAPFLLIAGAGLREAGVAQAGALLPGTVPLWVAAASMLASHGAVRLGAVQGLGLGMIVAAVVVTAGPALVAGEGWQGPALLLCASWLAALYTLTLRGAGISALEATAVVSLLSMLGFAPLYLTVLEPGLGAVGWGHIAGQLAWQGVLSGLLAPTAFAFAVARVGAARAASFGALSPAAASGFGLALLGEWPDFGASLGLLAAIVGVALAARPR
ncbi:EamA family transporter [Falsiroseomonas sp. HW251]|uniref:EamA family transporter n=1 Tax=Falsiroseomonas sp. HW251 TaxID=3390998 RepID=UPI003D31D3C3